MSLETLIKKRIRSHGPLRVSDYMALTLTHPDYGYYMRKDPLGKKGDFITAPEVSQVFGELLGAWMASQWIAMGKPQSALVELGPGRGTLMADALRATKNIPGFHEAISVHLVEASPVLKQKQWNTLAGKYLNLHWHESFDEIPDKALLLIANEFFDALPIRQYLYLEGSWQERFITLDDKGKLQFTHAGDAGRMVERCESGKEWAAAIAKRMMQFGGAALIIDYGYNGPPKNSKETLQAMRNHASCDVLDKPGTADLTAHVDFHALRQAAAEEGALGYDLVTQGEFLTRLGAAVRAAALCEHATPKQKASILSGLERLISVEQMGGLFKVLCLTHPAHPKPEGL